MSERIEDLHTKMEENEKIINDNYSKIKKNKKLYKFVHKVFIVSAVGTVVGMSAFGISLFVSQISTLAALGVLGASSIAFYASMRNGGTLLYNIDKDQETAYNLRKENNEILDKINSTDLVINKKEDNKLETNIVAYRKNNIKKRSLVPDNSTKNNKNK